MGLLVLSFFYGSILFFLICSVLRGRKAVLAPLHLHWELYSGSSVYEQTDWWKKTHDTFGKKLIGVALDILFLREFYRRNRKFWYALFCFHAGLYLLILWHLWLFVSAVFVEAETASSFGWVGGTFSTALAFVGGVGILFKRLTDEELRVYYPKVHYLKWAFILLTLMGGFLAVDFHFHSSMPELLKYVRDQVTFQNWEHKFHPAPLPALHVLFASMWLIYLPFGHVFELFFRFYHHLRWDDVPNQRGSVIEKRVKELLDRPLHWSAPHIQPGKRWKEAASETPPAPGPGTK